MSRLRRVVQSDCYFFVTCNVRKVLPRAGQSSRYADPVMLLEDADYAHLADAIEASRKQFAFLLTAWVFMPDHWHAILCPRQPSGISAAMQLIKQRSTHAIGLARKESIRLWQPRFHEHALRTVREYIDAVEYIHLNPVRRNLVARPEDWKWSSVHDYSPGAVSPLPVDRVNLPTDSMLASNAALCGLRFLSIRRDTTRLGREPKGTSSPKINTRTPEQKRRPRAAGRAKPLTPKTKTKGKDRRP